MDEPDNDCKVGIEKSAMVTLGVCEQCAFRVPSGYWKRVLRGRWQIVPSECQVSIVKECYACVEGECVRRVAECNWKKCYADVGMSI